MRIHYLQHVPFEDMANIGLWIKGRGHELSGTKFFAGERPGPETAFDLLVIMGGPMNIYEEDKFPWLTAEKKFIEKAVAAEKCVLGICLGAQLMADVLGGRVYKNKHREIGWHPVTLTPEAKNTAVFGTLPERFTAFHWHGDTFDTPPGAVCTAKSEACGNQAFEYNKRVIGLQFHLESSPSSVEALLNNCSDELAKDSYIQTPEEIISGIKHIEKQNEIMFSILNRLENLAAPKTATAPV
ncbi:glutamine amidotransferase class-I [Desulfocucumis palustris]|uniref:Glutamine amidotransferase class-I n=1 Tax=Desulfocucumis palustris TaxID=1898651 RepID=A0A2L2XEA3_9FIRM|nr:type 1 glutamine amidotransferase [Desulfocucumis palustris]GBF34558.1 glutamine amidotransferase class-I [Desulfocucumis palustris]